MRYLVPIASESDLFPRSDYHFPKPLIEVDGEAMISRVISNIRDADPAAEFIFVVRNADCREFSLDRSLTEATLGRCRIVRIDKPTAGAACSALLAIAHINDDEPLVVCNGDQIVEHGIGEALASFIGSGADAGVITFESVHPRWSYVRLNANGDILEAAEKRVISRTAIAGFYYFRTGAAFVRAAQRSILNERSVDGRFFVAPVLNELVLEGQKIAHWPVAAEDYQSLFSPQRLESYERQIQARRWARVDAADKPATILVPMAGLGSRFAEAGYAKPKPFIDVAGMTMIERVMDNLSVESARFILVARQEHLEREPDVVQSLTARGDVSFVGIDLVTEGAACTVLTARAAWDPDAPLVLANCDQLIDFDCEAFIADARARKLDGSIVTFKDEERDPKWSFARLGANDLVEEVREKVAISDTATVGIYYFRSAQIFVDAAVDMISRNDRVNGEYYVCPVYNYMIARGGKVGVYNVAPDAMHGIGTPVDLDRFLALGRFA